MTIGVSSTLGQSWTIQSISVLLGLVTLFLRVLNIVLCPLWCNTERVFLVRKFSFNSVLEENFIDWCLNETQMVCARYSHVGERKVLGLMGKLVLGGCQHRYAQICSTQHDMWFICTDMQICTNESHILLGSSKLTKYSHVRGKYWGWASSHIFALQKCCKRFTGWAHWTQEKERESMESVTISPNYREREGCTAS